MLKYSVGIDIAFKKFDVCLSAINSDQHVVVKASRQFQNTQKGIQELLVWIKKNHKQVEIPLVVCMEATGIYYEHCALSLFQAGYAVSVILPNKAKKYLNSLGLKSKNDKIDARGLSRMGAEQKLGLWQPMGNYFYVLRSMTRQLQSFQEAKTTLSNQLHAAQLAMYDLVFIKKQQKKLLSGYEKAIENLTQEIEAHLKSNELVFSKVKNILAIKGVGILTVAVLLAETNGFELFTSASQLVSYAGLDAVENQSGGHVGKTRISKKGNSRIRRILFMPGFTAVKDKSSVFAKLYQRVFERTNLKMKGYVAVHKKLLVIIYALWKKNEQYKIQPENNSKDEELVTASQLTDRRKKIVPTKAALNKVINSIDESQFDSSQLMQI